LREHTIVLEAYEPPRPVPPRDPKYPRVETRSWAGWKCTGLPKPYTHVGDQPSVMWLERVDS
jgi:hypothetical protein